LVKSGNGLIGPFVKLGVAELVAGCEFIAEPSEAAGVLFEGVGHLSCSRFDVPLCHKL